MNKWISIKDKLPDDYDFVLVARDNGLVTSMEAMYKYGEFIVHRFGMKAAFEGPTHWMEIPQPSMEEQTDETKI